LTQKKPQYELVVIPNRHLLAIATLPSLLRQLLQAMMGTYVGVVWLLATGRHATRQAAVA
jgi:hypothetical protein